MSNIIKLEKGEIYFLVGFFDDELKYPSIGTYIYEGLDEDDEHSHLFINVVGYLNSTSNSDEEGGGHYISFPVKKINGILDKEHLIQWLDEEHSPKLIGKKYEYNII